MPNPPYTILRGRVFYLNYRYPSDLVKAKLVAKSHAKFSLKTTSRSEAKAKAAREVAFIESEIEEIRKRARQAAEKFERRSNSDRQLRSFAKLTQAEQRDLALRWFVEMERAAKQARLEPADPRDLEQRRKDLEIAGNDLNVLEGTSMAFAPVDWQSPFRELLNKEGIALDYEDEAGGLIELLRRAEIESQWRTLSALEGRPYEERDPVFKGVHADSKIRDTILGHSRSIADICEIYSTRKNEGKISKATVASYVLPIRIFKEFFTPKKALSTLSFEDGERLIGFLATVPINAKVRYPKCSLIDAAKHEAKKDPPKCLSPKRQKDVFNAIKAIINYAVERGWLERNPFQGKALADRLPRVEQRVPAQFSIEELNALFQAPMYLQERGRIGPQGALEEGRFWIPLLGLFHGLRANEAASLLITDIKEEDGVPFLDVKETDEEGNREKRLKTSSSTRRIPIHDAVIGVGFLDFVASQRAAGQGGFLFPELAPDRTTENRAKQFSQWFGRLRFKVLGEEVTKEYGKNFHSFRHAVTDKLRAASESDEKRYALLGWSGSKGKQNAGFDYGSGFPLADLQSLINQVQFEGVNLPSV